MSETQSKTSPIMAIAAVAVTIFSIVGVGVMTGVIPSSKSETASQLPDVKTTEVAPKPAEPRASSAPRVATPAVKKPDTKAAANEPSPAAAPAPPAAATAPVQVAAAPAAVVAPPRVCLECGIVDTINVVEQKGQGSGIGAVGGAVVGGLLGNQVGSGRGNTAATVVGAVGGALAGNEVERRVKTTKQYNISVRMDDGNFKTFSFDAAPAFTVGDKVKVIDGKIVRG